MIYLDEDITVRFETYAYNNTFANYEVVINGLPIENKYFDGRVFIQHKKEGKNPYLFYTTIYLNDIIESLCKKYWNLDRMAYKNQYVINRDDVGEFSLMFDVDVRLILNDGTVKRQVLEDVCAVYRYPNENRPELPTISNNRELAYVVLDGYDIETGKYALLPRFPLAHSGSRIDTDILTFSNIDSYISIGIYSGNTRLKTIGTITPKSQRTYTVDGHVYPTNFMYEQMQNGVSSVIDTEADTYLAFTANNSVFSYYVIKANGLQPNVQEQDAESILFHEFGMTEDEIRDAMADITAGVPTIIYQTKSHLPNVSDEEYLEWQTKKGIASGYFTYASGAGYIPEPFTYRVANIDVCPERYYLYWEDRLGGVQCQPFKQYPMFKEKIARTMIKNQYGQKRLGVADITPKWELKSSWITEEEYPYYESLLISPTVLLYDTKTYKMFKVNVVDTDYTEKTHKNQNGNLLNFNITVEENKNQRIIH